MELINKTRVMNAAAFGLLIAVCVINVAAQSTTKPVAAPQPVEQRSENRDRQNRGYNRDRRGRDRNASAAQISTGDPFVVLNTRSIFVKGNQQITPGNSAAQSNQPSGALVKKPEASLVFNGVTVIDGAANAFIEDLTVNHVSMVRVGDGIAGGKVSAISFDTLSYEANGKVLNITLGQNLEGNLAVSSGADATPGATTLPFAPGYIGVGASNGAITGGMSPEDILARMKAKRQAELGRK